MLNALPGQYLRGACSYVAHDVACAPARCTCCRFGRVWSHSVSSLDRHGAALLTFSHFQDNRQQSPESHHSQDLSSLSSSQSGSHSGWVGPNVVPISKKAFSALLPLAGTGDQVLAQLGGPPTWLRRGVLSVSAAVLLYNVNTLLTALAAFYWAWAPMWSAALPNIVLRSKFRHAGVWRARILAVEPEPRSRKLHPRRLRVVIGEDNGPCFEMSTQEPKGRVLVTRGQQAEVLVLSDSLEFESFRAVHEVYLPPTRLWLGDGRNLERTVFEEMSEELAALLADLQQQEDAGDEWDGLYSLAEESHEEHVRRFPQYGDNDEVASPAASELGSTVSTGWSKSFDSDYAGLEPCNASDSLSVEEEEPLYWERGRQD